MQRAARSYLTAAAALAAGGMIAVTPTLSSVPGIQARPVELLSGADIVGDDLTNLLGLGGVLFADPLLNLQAEEIGANTALVGDEITGNTGLVTAEESLLSSLGSAIPDPTGVTTAAATVGVGSADPALAFDRLVDVNNLFLSTSENVFNSVLGADNFDPAAINASLLLDSGAFTGPVPYITPDFTGGGGLPVGTGAPFLDGQIGGLEGVTGNSLAADGDLIAYLNTQLGLSVPDFLVQDIPALGNALIAFNDALIEDELEFNTNLLTNEEGAELAALGSNQALNGVVDRLINIDNLPLATAENELNSLLGATDPNITPADLTASLLTEVGGTPTDPTFVFDTGDLGGLEGLFDQNAALFADLAGLNSAEITSALAPGVFDTTAFDTAISGLFAVSDFSNLATDFTPVLTELGAVIAGMF